MNKQPSKADRLRALREKKAEKRNKKRQKRKVSK